MNLWKCVPLNFITRNSQGNYEGIFFLKKENEFDLFDSGSMLTESINDKYMNLFFIQKVKCEGTKFS